VPTTRRPTSPRTSRTRTTPRANGNQASSAARGRDLDLEIVTIAPELAQEWLDRGGNNGKIQAGIPVRSVVARGVSEDAFEVMDTGRSRNAADVLHIHSNSQNT
jgi:hypothetical protein